MTNAERDRIQQLAFMLHNPKAAKYVQEQLTILASPVVYIDVKSEDLRDNDYCANIVGLIMDARA